MPNNTENKVFLGIDTSNYTTSVAVCTVDGEIIANVRKMLPVRHGECGLRQSDAVFAHVKNLPACMDEIKSKLSARPDLRVAAVGVSEKPRDAEDSYMPCFLPGIAAAHSFAAALSYECQIYGFSHQCGHISAAVYSSGAVDIFKFSKFLAFHVSGGTTDLLYVTFDRDGLRAESIGGSLDINAGQAIDRTGVRMGLSFPCGAEMEKLASERDCEGRKTKISVKDTYCNLSGLENLASELYAKTRDAGLVSAYVFDFIGDTLCEMTKAAIMKFGQLPVIYAGGVMRNYRIRKKLSEYENSYFAQPEFSSDNAAGTALLAKDRFLFCQFPQTD